MPGVGEDRPEPPFLVRLFYNSGSLIHPERFVDPALLSFINVYTWPSCTLQELIYELADARPNPLPSPAIGTRVVFQHVSPDLKRVSAVGGGRAKFAIKDLGSSVVGAGGPGAEDDEHPNENRGYGGTSTLQDAHFAAGDYISCAILPPLDDGSVAPAYDAIKSQQPPRRTGPGQPATFSSRQNKYSRNSRNWDENEAPRFPRGDWSVDNQRQPPSRGRGRGRGRGRW
ncbi:hypothetical protein LLEC1_01122 [Akanthomyces lecanii]|uniref:Sin3 associated polypeptide p18 n=1 Tax=Cordyceps confragosa TaxID=2714763 RepID=A0A179I767_CORDF|nr:hypothetical protein LLEC1_01122 [Akanthomyces lecanii]